MKRKTDFKKILARHASMILDARRTKPLKSAIDREVKEGDVVCDIGAGLGLLTFYALSAGARHVYAIDCDTESLNVAINYATDHGITNRITFIEGHSQYVDIDKKADVLICETIGSAAFDENILATLFDAKKRLLKKKGKIIPASISLWGAPTNSFVKKANQETITTTKVFTKELLCKPVCLSHINTGKNFKREIHIKNKFKSRKNSTLRGMAIWPRIEWAKNLITDASPYKSLTHWKQCLLPLPSKKIKKDEHLYFELIIKPGHIDPLEQTEILWKVRSPNK